MIGTLEHPSIAATVGDLHAAMHTHVSEGAQDTLGIANGGWQCGHSNNVNNKVDINNAYIGKGTMTYSVLQGFWADAGESIEALAEAGRRVFEYRTKKTK